MEQLAQKYAAQLNTHVNDVLERLQDLLNNTEAVTSVSIATDIHVLSPWQRILFENVHYIKTFSYMKMFYHIYVVKMKRLGVSC